MKFSKDILLIDLETTGLDSAKYEIIQLAAIVLDKKTLKEKSEYSSFIKPNNWSTRDGESMAINKIEYAQVRPAPALKSVLLELSSLTKQPVILANWGGHLDSVFLQTAYRKTKLDYPFDYHIFNIWGLAFAYLAKKELLKNSKKYTGFSLNDLVKRFKIKNQGQRHDALADCRLEAEVLRHIMKKL